MKYMKKGKGLALLLALALALGLSACAGGEDAGTSSSSRVNTSSAPAEPQVPPLDEDAVTVLLEDMVEYEPDTAGSSLKLCQLGAGLLNFTETFEEGQESALRSVIETFTAGLDEDQAAHLKETLPAVQANAESILAGGDEITALLNDAGNPQYYDTYTPERYQTVSAILTELL